MNLKLLKIIRSVCPKNCIVKSLSTRRKGNPDLVVVKFPANMITRGCTVYDWEIEQTHDLHHSKIRPLKLPEGDRMFYYCGEFFVFYSPYDGFLKDFGKYTTYKVFGEYEYQRYVGECCDINKLLSYLTDTEDIVY